MAGYTETYLLCTEEQALRKIAMAVAKTAWYISAEAANADQHALRMALVNHAGPRLSDYMSFSRELAAYLFTQNATLTAASADSAYDTAIAGIWNVYAAALVARGVLTVA